MANDLQGRIGVDPSTQHKPAGASCHAPVDAGALASWPSLRARRASSVA